MHARGVQMETESMLEQTLKKELQTVDVGAGDSPKMDRRRFLEGFSALAGALVATNPNPAVAKQPEANDLAAGRAVDTKPCDVTVLESRPFCMNDEGVILQIGHPELQVPRPGNTEQGTPSYGECLRVIAEGVADIKQRNGGVIPEGYDVVVVNQLRGGFCFRVNPEVIPDIVDLSPEALRAARRDRLTDRAIVGLHNRVKLMVENVGDGLITMSFFDPSGNRNFQLLVALEKPQR